MTVAEALFPSAVPAPPPPPRSLDTPEKSPRDNGGAETAPPTPGRERRTVYLPPRPARARRGEDPKEDRRALDRLALNDEIAAVLFGVCRALPGDLPAWLEAKLDAVIVKAHRKPIAAGYLDVPEKTGREWLYDQAGDLLGCSQCRAYREAQCGEYHAEPISCRSRVCANCERSRSAKVLRVYRAVLEAVPARRRAFEVLTVRNQPLGTLDESQDFLIAAVASLRRRPLNRGGRCRMRQRDGSPMHPCKPGYCSMWSAGGHRSCEPGSCSERIAGGHRCDRNCRDFLHPPVVGGVISFELTTNSDDAIAWHPHANLISDAPFRAQAELADLWRAITCSDPKHRRAGWCPQACDAGSPVVHIKQVKPGTVRDAIKYVTKSWELLRDPVRLAEFMLATRGRHMVQGFGSFYGLDLVEPPADPNDRDAERVVLEVTDPVAHDAAGQPVVRKHCLPRYCRSCGRDTDLSGFGGGCTYEAPILVPRAQVHTRNGALVWRPPPRAGPGPGAAELEADRLALVAPAGTSPPAAVPLAAPATENPVDAYLRAIEPRGLGVLSRHVFWEDLN